MDRDALAAPVTVAIVDDHPVTIEGMRSWLGKDPAGRVRLVASGSSIEAVLAGPGRPAAAAAAAVGAGAYGVAVVVSGDAEEFGRVADGDQ